MRPRRYEGPSGSVGQSATTITLPRGKSWPGLIVGGVVLAIGVTALFVVSNPLAGLALVVAGTIIFLTARLIKLLSPEKVIAD